jgi:N-formylglutamate deformylase
MNTGQAGTDWLTVWRGTAPLVLSIPHAGTDLLYVREQLRSPWLATMDADWWVDQLYDFARELDVTLVKTAISRTVIDVNRDPAARELYPGMASTELVPTTTFDGVALYPEGSQPSGEEQALRRTRFHEPYHAVLRAELQRLRQQHSKVVLYDAHSIRSHVPRLFEGQLPLFNIGTFSARSCAPGLTAAVSNACRTLPVTMAGSQVIDGRFKGGYITRNYGRPDAGMHAIQMELACRGYLDEPPLPLDAANWPPAFIKARAEPLQRVLREVLVSCLDFAGAAS